ncbi:MAG: 50S ribosomal protein L29 [Bacteroidales bacterium]|nr:50S ribosomal protein L29 [Bacteroidales bacterium]
MKASEIKGLTVAEIEEKLASARVELQKMELAHVVTPIENPMKIRSTRKDIARMATILAEKKNSENK